MKSIVLVYLVALGIKDCRERKVSVWMLCVGGVLLPGIGVYRCIHGQLAWLDMAIGAFPGLFLLVVAWLSRKAGYGDGMVLLQLGLCAGYRRAFGVFGFSMLMLSLVSIVLLLLKKVGRETRMPYIAFLAMAYLLGG